MASREAGALAAMVAATLLWGATFVVIRDLVATLAPAALIFARFAAAAALLGGILLVRRRAPERAAWVGGAVSGLLGAAGFVLQAAGLTATSAGSSAFLTCAGTLFTALFAWVLFRERPGGALLAGLALALVGSGFLTLREGLRPGRGELLTLLGALAFALQIVAIGRVARRADAVALAAVQAATMALVLIPAAPAAARGLAALDADGWARVGYLLVAGSVVAPLLLIMAQRTLPAGRVGLLFALEPLFALLFALTLGQERFAPRWWLGAALILAAVALVEWRALRAEASSPPASG